MADFKFHIEKDYLTSFIVEFGAGPICNHIMSSNLSHFAGKGSIDILFMIDYPYLWKAKNYVI